MSTDRIEKEILIQATPSRVWRAITDPKEFGSWFGARLEGEFAPGNRVQGEITSAGCAQMAFEIIVESLEPERLFSYRWYPAGKDLELEEAQQLTTLVEFRLEPVDSATRVSIVESGFDQFPARERESLFERNQGGWSMQTKNLERHVTTH